MSKSKSQVIDFKGMDDLIQQIEALDQDLKPIIEKSLMESAQRATVRMQGIISNPSSYPANGVYYTGETARRALTPEIIWKSATWGYVRWGIDSKDYKVPFYMLFGTDRVKGSSKLRSAIFSATVRKDFETDMEETLQKAVSDFDR